MDKLLIELNWAIHTGTHSLALPQQDAASLTALLLDAGFDPAEFPERLPLGAPKERWLDPMQRSRQATEAELGLELETA